MSIQIKNLKDILSKKGLECKSCSEKADFVKMVFDSQSLPDIASKSQSTPPPPPPNPPKQESPEELEEVSERFIIIDVKSYFCKSTADNGKITNE
jgi:hypothetical protein